MSQRDREPREDDLAAAHLTIEPVGPPVSESRLTIAGGVAAALLLIVIVKPWGVGGPEPSMAPALRTPEPAEVTPVPTQDRTAEGLAQPICLGTGAWRIVSVETWRTQDVRVWRAIEPVTAAAGPLDPTIPSVPIVALELRALGWCAPAFGPGKPIGPATVSAWTVESGRATALDLLQVRPDDGVTPIAALYVPLTSCPEQMTCAPLLQPPVPMPWATGHVVFRYRDGATGHEVWFAADVQILGLPAGSGPAPGPTANPSQAVAP